MLLIHYLVGVSHFAVCRNNRPVTVWEMLINLSKSPIPQWRGKWKSDSEYVSPPKVNQFLRSIDPIIRPNFTEIGSLLLQLSWQNDRTNEWMTNKPHNLSALAELTIASKAGHRVSHWRLAYFLFFFHLCDLIASNAVKMLTQKRWLAWCGVTSWWRHQW